MAPVVARDRRATATSGTIFAIGVLGGKRLAIAEQVYEYRSGQHLVASLRQQ